MTQRDVVLLGPTFERLWPVEDAPGFDDLLKAIDDADSALHEERRAAGGEGEGQADKGKDKGGTAARIRAGSTT